MGYIKTPLKDEIAIDYIVTIHYFEYMKDFVFEGETHDFWEFVCVDVGEIEVFDGKEKRILKRGDVFFHEPMEFHALKATGRSAPCLVVVTFGSDSPAMDFFRHRRLRYTEHQRELLSNIVVEAKKAFSTPLGDPSTKRMDLRANEAFASQQLIKLYLQLFLINAVRTGRTETDGERSTEKRSLSTAHHKQSDEDIVSAVKRYFAENINRPLTVGEICHDNFISYSRLKQVFKSKLGCGVLEYFNLMRTERAKELIREGELNVSEISGHLGYSSIHYFSRHFKQTTGMSPSEYAQSIKALTDRKTKM
ncbi:MAG: helix-turn-helix domain-containing protein [Lachnospiraceae bacterium]|nr:helix-turn-helix domain-containing protein [Lachnospiraceae bacterium]